MPLKHSTVLVEEAMRLYKIGLSSRQVAVQLKCGHTSVVVAAKAAGLSRTREEANQLRQPSIRKHWRAARKAARKVWKRQVGHIPSGYHIHHKNGDYTDNRIENLEALSVEDHRRAHGWMCPGPARTAYIKAYNRKCYLQKKARRAAQA